MSIGTLTFWLFVTAWVVVAAIFALGIAPRIVREIQRMIARVTSLVGGSRLPLQLAQAEADATRIGRALDRLPALQSRAARAIALLRAARFVPPGVRPLVARIEREIQAFRAAGP